MSLYFIEGPAGTGKTTQLFQEFEQVFASAARCSMQSYRRCSSGTALEDLK